MKEKLPIFQHLANKQACLLLRGFRAVRCLTVPARVPVSRGKTMTQDGWAALSIQRWECDRGSPAVKRPPAT